MRDGTRLAFSLRQERQNAPRVALIHSLAMEGRFWQPVADRLADASVLLYDCRGHGRSDKPAGPYTVELFARDLADLMDHIGWDGALVAGGSMGGCVALAFAAAFPARTRALGLVDTTAWYGPDAPKNWAERARRAADSGLAAMAEFQTTRWFTDAFRAAHPEIVRQSVETFLANDIAAYGETCRMLGACDLRAALPGVTASTAVIVGEEDYATPIAMARALHEGISGSTLTILPNARHLTPLEAPQAIADALRALMEREGQR